MPDALPTLQVPGPYFNLALYGQTTLGGNGFVLHWTESMKQGHRIDTRPLLFFLALVMSVVAACGGSQFIPDALDHARQAVERGKDGDPNALAEQASVALRYAQMAEREKSTDHLKQSIKNLKSAIQHARYGRIQEGTKAAEDAVMSLFEAQ